MSRIAFRLIAGPHHVLLFFENAKHELMVYTSRAATYAIRLCRQGFDEYFTLLKKDEKLDASLRLVVTTEKPKGSRVDEYHVMGRSKYNGLCFIEVYFRDRVIEDYPIFVMSQQEFLEKVFRVMGNPDRLYVWIEEY